MMDTSKLNPKQWKRIDDKWYERIGDNNVYIDFYDGLGHVIDYDTDSDYLCGVEMGKLYNARGVMPICEACWNAYLAKCLTE